MKIEGTYTTQATREQLFALLLDEKVVCRCIPGCRRLVREGEDSFAATLDVGVGSVQGSYEGIVRFAEKVPPERLEMIVDGKGKLGFVRGKSSLQLAPAENAPQTTLITYQADLQIGGTIAGVGQRMLQSVAKMMAGQFFAALGAEAKAAETASALAVKHGPLRNFLRWLRSILRDVFRRRARTV